MTTPPFFVMFAAVREDCPLVPIIGEPADSLEESVQLRAKDGSLHPVPTIFGPILFQLKWLGCLDHIPDEEECNVLMEQAMGSDE